MLTFGLMMVLFVASVFAHRRVDVNLHVQNQHVTNLALPVERPVVTIEDFEIPTVPEAVFLERKKYIPRFSLLSSSQISERTDSLESWVRDLNGNFGRRPVCRRQACHTFGFDLRRHCCELTGVCCPHPHLHHRHHRDLSIRSPVVDVVRDE
ncbi:uncharacterized protein LOC100908083 [Galendromus occidentalis]|uniref:Uncharacterized protein LOC100908083 n=1 Tax=Galendromus occidentalis TaxID=34638 RepID=A0AAJ6QTP9_9ACAR|nr:uncharacterized protein LOC100908083 [Galendromus occidentalis]